MSTKVKQYDIESKAYTTTGTASAYELTIQKLDSLYDELTFVVEFHVENDASATLNINSLGAIAIMTSEGNAVDAGDLKTTGRYTLVYDDDTARFVVSEMVDSDVEAMIIDSTWIPIAGTDIQTSSVVDAGWFSDNNPKSTNIFTVNKAGTYTIQFDGKGNGYSYTHLQLRINGINVRAFDCNSYQSDPAVHYTHDITVNVGDVISIYGVDGQSGSSAHIYNCALWCDVTPNIDTSSWITPA